MGPEQWSHLPKDTQLRTRKHEIAPAVPLKLLCLPALLRLLGGGRKDTNTTNSRGLSTAFPQQQTPASLQPPPPL